VALFANDPGTHATEGGSAPRPSRARRAGWISLMAAMAIALILSLVPSPYVIERPGPVYNTLGTAEAEDGTETSLITIPDETVYPTEGELSLLTVSVVGNRENAPRWINVLAAWLNPNEAVLPMDLVFPADVSTEDREAQNSALMVNSQQDAVAAALTHLGYDYPTTVTVVSVPDGSPANGILLPDDQIMSVNDTGVATVTELREALAVSGAGADALITIVRDGTEQSVTVVPKEVNGVVVAGIGVTMEYQFPIEVNLELDRVGGPSAGMMFALGIIDKLTPGLLQGGENVAGTGSIDQAGTVGPIGGIRQKLVGASDAGADWFLAPAENCDEVTGHIPDNLNVFAVKTLDEAVNVLDAIRTGADTSELPSCPVG
jgi:PDZ domain-containing protein